MLLASFVSRALLRRLFPILTLAGTLIGIELLLRLAGVAYPAFDRPTVGLREWGVPGAEGWAVGENRNWVKLNREGARDRDHALEKPADTIRVVVVGDSYTSAFHVDLEETFWSVAESALAGCEALGDRRVELLSFAKPGYGTVEELLVLRRFGFRYDPDWVVLAFLTGNDFRNNSKALKASDRPYLELQDGEWRLDERYAERAKFKRWSGVAGDLWYGLVGTSRIVQVGRQLQRAIKASREAARRETLLEGAEPGLDDEIYRAPSTPAWQSAWATTEALIERMRDESRTAGARFLLVTLSNAIQVHPDATLRRSYAERMGVDELFYPDRRLAAFAAQQGIPVLTLAPRLRAWAERHDTCVHGFEAPWICQGHWNAFGHRAAGLALAEQLCRLLPVDASRPLLRGGVSIDRAQSVESPVRVARESDQHAAIQREDGR